MTIETIVLVYTGITRLELKLDAFDSFWERIINILKGAVSAQIDMILPNHVVIMTHPKKGFKYPMRTVINHFGRCVSQIW